MLFRKEPANVNLDVKRISVADLQSLLPRYDEGQFDTAKRFQDAFADETMNFIVKRVHKYAKKNKTPIELVFSVAAVVMTSIAMTFAKALSNRNPIAGEALKRHLKETMNKL